MEPINAALDTNHTNDINPTAENTIHKKTGYYKKYIIGSVEADYSFNVAHLLHGVDLQPAIVGIDKATGVRWIEYYDNGNMVNGPAGYHRIMVDKDGLLLEITSVESKDRYLYVKIRCNHTTVYHAVDRTTGNIYTSNAREYLAIELAGYKTRSSTLAHNARPIKSHQATT